MNNNPKYRLKKDTPEFKAGEVFEMIHNIDVGDVLAQNAFRQDIYEFEVDLIDNFDEWFEVAEEPKKEPKWVRKQIKAVHGKGTRINYMVVKTFYLPVGDWDSEHKTAFRMEPGEVAGFVGYDEDVKGYINQMVKLGYIEVEDNPNIVWEDENEIRQV